MIHEKTAAGTASACVAENATPPGGLSKAKPALLEHEAIRFAESFDDYEHVSVADMGGWGPDGFWVVVTDERFGLRYEIACHCDYRDFIGGLVDHRQGVELKGIL